MSDKDNASKIARAMLDEARAKIRPIEVSMTESMTAMMAGLAKSCGEEITDANKFYYDCLGAIVFSTGIQEAETITKIVTAYQTCRHACEALPAWWHEAAVVCDKMQDIEDNGEELGFGLLLRVNPDDPTQRAKMLRQCAEFYAVPDHHRERIGQLVEFLFSLPGMSTARGLPVMWARSYELTVCAMIAACDPPRSPATITMTPDGKVKDGGWRSH